MLVSVGLSVSKVNGDGKDTTLLHYNGTVLEVQEDDLLAARERVDGLVVWAVQAVAQGVARLRAGRLDEDEIAAFETPTPPKAVPRPEAGHVVRLIDARGHARMALVLGVPCPDTWKAQPFLCAVTTGQPPNGWHHEPIVHHLVGHWSLHAPGDGFTPVWAHPDEPPNEVLRHLGLAAAHPASA